MQLNMRLVILVTQYFSSQRQYTTVQYNTIHYNTTQSKGEKLQTIGEKQWFEYKILKYDRLCNATHHKPYNIC